MLKSPNKLAVLDRTRRRFRAQNGVFSARKKRVERNDVLKSGT